MNKLNSPQATPVTLFIPTFSPAFTRTIKPLSLIFLYNNR